MGARIFPLSKSSTACDDTNETANTFAITHPFHPLYGKRFALVTRKQTWGEDRVTYFDQNGKLCSMLTSWTDLTDTDYFLQVSAGRSWFRVDDLLNLNMMLKTLLERHQNGKGSVR